MGYHILTFVCPDEELSCYFYVEKDNLLTAATSDASAFLFGFVIFLVIIAVIIFVTLWRIIVKQVEKTP